MGLQLSGRLLAMISIALLAGIYLGDVVGVRHARSLIDPAGFVQMQQAIHVRFVRLMPPLILAGLLGNVLWLWTIRAQVWSLPFWLVLLSLLGIVAIAAMTRAVNVPLNQQLMTWTSASPPADLHHLWQPWEQINQLRLLLSLAVLAAELSLLALRKG